MIIMSEVYDPSHAIPIEAIDSLNRIENYTREIAKEKGTSPDENLRRKI
jgi:hypothetical protein